ncbi:UDP-N-acetylglucosamine 2-epimerase (non-hydrolyzing) [Trichococcus sp. K1Tr]|uniref:non-hydrolyzing UDP-N-acetylglucosamine 2-epimerase n=1 Tax=Trichococcus sp. K1Tr TaxID=3020847 RepID=UPI00232F81F7|nr:UDP-N-acetylglucosamine 2-epimerase (non-hydrolyzing) [Trichococcus sp. K1Tr]MDB6354118.1 UDP-N-acetylglucosamine 2-epimerase (non-hydrolyzing) [Trichococcus sp. K1Tr]
MKKIKVMTIFGTRPEAIKMAPLVKELEKQSDRFESIVTVTAQHRQMLDQVLTIFDIKPDYDLNVMKDRQTLSQITANVLMGLEAVMLEAKPDIVLVHGDTTTTFAAAISAFYHNIKVGHVEAGLRTWNKYSPFPEEINRQVTDVISDLYFAPTTQSEINLLKENHDKNTIFITGNTAIDALTHTVREDYENGILSSIPEGRKIILMTMHRRENQGKPMEQVFRAIRQVVDEYPDIEIIYPVHLNPVVQELANAFLGNHERIHLIAPLDVIDFHNVAARSYMIMSDSGGVQEEAPSLGIPVLVLRDTTERPEGVDAGTLKLVGTETNDVIEAMTELLDNPALHKKMSEAKNPYGDGKASQRILDCIAYEFGCMDQRPEDFKY